MRPGTFLRRQRLRILKASYVPANSLRAESSGPVFIIIAHQDDMQEARSMHSLDARHFNIGRGAWAGDIRRECRGFGTTIEILGQRFHYLAGAQDAEMPVRQQSDRAASFVC